MPAFEERVESDAPALALWRLLHDPRRFPEWWVGTERVEVEEGRLTRYLDGWPDFPMPMTVEPGAAGRRVVVSCLVSDIVSEWSLAPAPAGAVVHVRVVFPAHEAHRVPAVRAEVRASLQRLVERAGGAPR